MADKLSSQIVICPRFFLTAFALLLMSAAAYGFVVLGPVWPSKSVSIQLRFGDSPTFLTDGSPSWNAVARGVMATWNRYLLRIQLVPISGGSVPQNGDGVNSAFFAPDLYSMDFGDTVAVTTIWTENGRRTRTEADMIFNSNLTWDSYGGIYDRVILLSSMTYGA